MRFNPAAIFSFAFGGCISYLVGQDFYSIMVFITAFLGTFIVVTAIKS